MPNDELIAEARAKCEGVTEGWRLWQDDPDEGVTVARCKPIGETLLSFPKVCEEVWEERDAEFIAWSRTGVPALADALEAALAENARLRTFVNHARYALSRLDGGAR